MLTSKQEGCFSTLLCNKLILNFRKLKCLQRTLIPYLAILILRSLIFNVKKMILSADMKTWKDNWEDRRSLLLHAENVPRSLTNLKELQKHKNEERACQSELKCDKSFKSENQLTIHPKKIMENLSVNNVTVSIK